jgi:peptidoglycan/LPS O-acetylase OafA/YrhL
MHDYSLKAIPPVWAQNIIGYSPNTNWNFDSFRWFWTHASFLFGSVPGMENSTPLPDWSLSLEMQFYLILPLLLISLNKISVPVIAILSALIAFVSPKLFGNYLDAGILTHFGQPSFLPYRLNAFLAGMLPALFLQQQLLETLSPKNKTLLIISALLCIAPLSKPVIVVYALFVLLVFNRAPLISRLLSISPLLFLGKISYSIYLCHILIVIPMIYWLIKDAGLMAMSSVERFTIGLLLTFPIVLICSYLLYIGIEKTSVSFWKNLSLKLK